MKKAFLILLICCQGILLNVSCGSGSLFEPDKRNALRAPSYPLISVDPYTSVWSFADELNADVTRHWTGKEQALLGVVDVDGVSYRFMGKETPEEGASVRFATATRQLSVNVLPTQTYYTFECGPVLLDVVLRLRYCWMIWIGCPCRSIIFLGRFVRQIKRSMRYG